MTIEDAIAHADERGTQSGACGAEHQQFAAWLRELVALRSERDALVAALRFRVKTGESSGLPTTAAELARLREAYPESEFLTGPPTLDEAIAFAHYQMVSTEAEGERADAAERERDAACAEAESLRTARDFNRVRAETAEEQLRQTDEATREANRRVLTLRNALAHVQDAMGTGSANVVLSKRWEVELALESAGGKDACIYLFGCCGTIRHDTVDGGLCDTETPGHPLYGWWYCEDDANETRSALCRYRRTPKCAPGAGFIHGCEP